jgi:hypothetical protein
MKYSSRSELVPTAHSNTAKTLNTNQRLIPSMIPPVRASTATTWRSRQAHPYLVICAADGIGAAN